MFKKRSKIREVQRTAILSGKRLKKAASSATAKILEAGSKAGEELGITKRASELANRAGATAQELSDKYAVLEKAGDGVRRSFAGRKNYATPCPIATPTLV